MTAESDDRVAEGTTRGAADGAARDTLATGVGRRIRKGGGLVAIAVSTGIVAGAGEFMYTRWELLPGGVEQWHAAAVVALAGGYVYALATAWGYDLRASVAAMLGALVVGFAVVLAAWLGPLWLYSYPPGARGLLLDRLLHQALVGTLLSYLTLVLGGYLAATSVGGYLDL